MPAVMRPCSACAIASAKPSERVAIVSDAATKLVADSGAALTALPAMAEPDALGRPDSQTCGTSPVARHAASSLLLAPSHARLPNRREHSEINSGRFIAV